MKNKAEKPQTNKDQFSEKPTEDKTVTRRNFIKNTAIAGAGAAAILQNESSQAQITDSLNIKIPEEIPQTLAEDTWYYGTTPLHIFRSIKFGAGLEMPPFKDSLDDETIWQIVAHVLNIGPAEFRPTKE